MKLTKLLDTFKVDIVPVKKGSKDAEDMSTMPGMVYPMLLAMDVKGQISAIKASSSFKNAFIDLIKLEAIPQVIIDHQAGTVLPFDEDSRYPSGNSERYTIIKNMKYIVENNSIKYKIFLDPRLYSHQFKELLRKYAYFSTNHTHGHTKGNTKLMQTIIDFLAHKVWNDENKLHEMKRGIKNIFYSELDLGISSLETLEHMSQNQYLYEKRASEMPTDFIDYATELGIEAFNTANYDEIRRVVRQDIDVKLDALVKKLNKYKLEDMYVNKNGMLDINLISGYPFLFNDEDYYEFFNQDEVLKYYRTDPNIAKVDYYFQHEECVKSSICNVNMSPVLGMTVDRLYGIFPNINGDFKYDYQLHDAIHKYNNTSFVY
jgi:hypothetical protein